MGYDHEADLRTGSLEKNDLARGSIGDVEKGGIFRWSPASPYAFSKGAQERYMGAEHRGLRGVRTVEKDAEERCQYFFQ